MRYALTARRFVHKLYCVRVRALYMFVTDWSVYACHWLEYVDTMRTNTHAVHTNGDAAMLEFKMFDDRHHRCNRFEKQKHQKEIQFE